MELGMCGRDFAVEGKRAQTHTDTWRNGKTPPYMLQELSPMVRGVLRYIRLCWRNPVFCN